jgi:Ca-activated chloride channel family protein
MIVFANPFWLLLLLLVPAVWLLPRWQRSRAAIRFPSVQILHGIRASVWQRLAWLPQALRAASLVFLVVALARPQRPNERTRVYSEGIAIQMVVDSSGSMQIEDFELNGKLATRLDAVKDVFIRFVKGDQELPGRPDDLIGLVKFANFPDVQCPLTLSHEALTHEIAALKTAIPSDDGTNIGDAVAWALEDLKSAKAKSKVLILLTDGVNQPVPVEGLPQPLEPIEAARIAQGLGIRIYTIGAGSNRGVARMKGQQVRVPPVDDRLLEQMADLTGGKYYRASDTAGLRQIYSEIDRLEKTRSDSVIYLDYKELFPLLAWAGLTLLCVEQCLVATRLRRIP